MSPLRLSDAQLREIQAAALMVPHDLRGAFLQRLALELEGKVLGDGTVHRAAYAVARALVFDAGRTAWGVPRPTLAKTVERPIAGNDGFGDPSRRANDTPNRQPFCQS